MKIYQILAKNKKEMITLLKFKFFNHRPFKISDFKFCQMNELKDTGCKEIGMFKGT